MVCTIAVLLALGFSYNSQIPYYFIYVIKAIYEIIYLCAYNFTVGPLEKFVFLLGEAIFIVIFSLFLFKSDSIPENELDFFALAILIVIDIFIFFPKFFIYACQKPTEPIADNQNAGYEPPQTSNEHLYRQ